MKRISLALAAICLLALNPATVGAQSRSNCEAQHESGKRKMEQENKKNEERRQEDRSEREETESALEKCLGTIEGIYKTGGGTLPSLPNVDDVINGLCKEVRKQIEERTSSASYYNDAIRGNNFVRPSDGKINLDIWTELNK